jgi:hypothetical protein
VTQETNVDASEQTLSTDPSDNHDQVAVSADMLQHIPVLDQNYIAALSPFLDQSGVATSGVSITVDGVEMKGTGVSASAIQEARINNDPYSVETNVPGKGRIEIMTKPATPAFHGTFNFGFRDSAISPPIIAAIRTATMPINNRLGLVVRTCRIISSMYLISVGKCVMEELSSHS